MKIFYIRKSLISIIAALCFVSITYADNTPRQETSKSLMQQLVDSYVNASKTNSTLKHLLDAKMYLNTAKHDLLISHNKKNAQKHIVNTLNYLSEAEKEAKQDIKKQLENLITNIKVLEKKTAKTTETENENETDKLLIEANNNLQKARQKATPSTQNKIDKIIAAIILLRNQIEHANLKSDYETAMQSLNSIIKNLE